MSETAYSYVVCDRCGTEERLDRRGTGLGASEMPPERWLRVINREHKRMWDLCAACSATLHRFVLERWLTKEQLDNAFTTQPPQIDKDDA